MNKSIERQVYELTKCYIDSYSMGELERMRAKIERLEDVVNALIIHLAKREAVNINQIDV